MVFAFVSLLTYGCLTFSPRAFAGEPPPVEKVEVGVSGVDQNDSKAAPILSVSEKNQMAEHFAEMEQLREILPAASTRQRKCLTNAFGWGRSLPADDVIEIPHHHLLNDRHVLLTAIAKTGYTLLISRNGILKIAIHSYAKEIAQNPNFLEKAKKLQLMPLSLAIRRLGQLVVGAQSFSDPRLITLHDEPYLVIRFLDDVTYRSL